jgi:hypothetical protein
MKLNQVIGQIPRDHVQWFGTACGCADHELFAREGEFLLAMKLIAEPRGWTNTRREGFPHLLPVYERS